MNTKTESKKQKAEIPGGGATAAMRSKNKRAWDRILNAKPFGGEVRILIGLFTHEIEAIKKLRADGQLTDEHNPDITLGSMIAMELDQRVREIQNPKSSIPNPQSSGPVEEYP